MKFIPVPLLIGDISLCQKVIKHEISGVERLDIVKEAPRNGVLNERESRETKREKNGRRINRKTE